ncbi:MCE family protein [Streptomyces piniterrae]|uniref:MCE family protein n=1 Tax=Streptomyces piniterrae TaxID=2571125 RepID=A0A4U0NRP2_9ACTN|nr:MlaD family protein [Streptomyces piniterrae]TJZ57177.1 MCE family protein [Streptomyces piniterrae]
MITRTVKAQLIAFSAVTAVGVSYVGAEYAGLGDRILDRDYTVRAHFADSGGIYSDAEVTYRGIPVGRVGDLRLGDSGSSVGVSVDLHIGDGSRIPADTLAVVANRSAVGEQYVDLQPRSRSGPYLRDGSEIAQKDTRTPLQTTQLIKGLDRFVASVDKRDLKITVDELGKAFAGTGPHLSRMVDSGNSLVKEASDSLPQTIKLIEDSQGVLQTQIDKGSSIKSFSRDLADLTEQIKNSDGDFRRLMDGQTSAAHEMDSLLKANQKALPVLLGNLISGGQVSAARLPGMEQTLVTFPAVVAGSFTVLPGDGTSHFGLALNSDEPPSCRQGYGSTQRRSPTDTSERQANTSVRCTEPRGSKTSVRGAQNVPRPGGSGSQADLASYVAPYDPASGLIQGPGGGTVQIGSTGGEQNVFGKDSWQWMLVGPMA